MTGIAPIPTQYNGYKFRSRLEARWAIFFDELKISYQYELEGFEIASGVWYLPDFKLDDCWLEVKYRDYDDNGADEKMGLLVAEIGTPGVIVYGDPLDHLAVLYRPHFVKPGFVRTVANFLNIHNSLQAAVTARQAQFEHGSNGHA